LFQLVRLSTLHLRLQEGTHCTLEMSSAQVNNAIRCVTSDENHPQVSFLEVRRVCCFTTQLIKSRLHARWNTSGNEVTGNRFPTKNKNFYLCYGVWTDSGAHPTSWIMKLMCTAQVWPCSQKLYDHSSLSNRGQSKEVSGIKPRIPRIWIHDNYYTLTV
jgi:hypothetical protein